MKSGLQELNLGMKATCREASLSREGSRAALVQPDEIGVCWHQFGSATWGWCLEGSVPAPNAILGDVVSSMSLRFWSQWLVAGAARLMSSGREAAVAARLAAVAAPAPAAARGMH